MMSIHSSPKITISGLEEILDLFKGGGSLSFEIPSKYRKPFKKHIDRINRSQRFYNKSRGFVGRFRYCLYFSYVAITSLILTWNQRELEHAFIVYSASWRFIASYDGKHKGGEIFVVTFNGRLAN